MDDIKAAVRNDGVVAAIGHEDGLRPELSGLTWAELSNKTLPPLTQDISDFISERQRLPMCYKVVNGNIVVRPLSEIKAEMGL